MNDHSGCDADRNLSVLAEYDCRWPDWFREETESIRPMVGGAEIYHVGGTAVEGICSRPIIDMLAVFNNVSLMYVATEKLSDHGYEIRMHSKGRISLFKGPTADGRMYSLDMRIEGDDGEKRFCDYLKRNPAVAREYGDLKVHLFELYPGDPDMYARGKGDFVEKHLSYM